MLRRYMLKRVDPWSVLKFGAIVSLVLFLVLVLTVGFVWYVLTSFDLVNRGCDVALDVGFTSCDIQAGVVFRASALVAGLIAVVHTAVLVFGAFLFNLIGELTGGIGIHLALDDETTPGNADAVASATAASPPTAGSSMRHEPPVNQPSSKPRDELFD